MPDHPITEADLAHLDALCAAASEGPWTVQKPSWNKQGTPFKTAITNSAGTVANAFTKAAWRGGFPEDQPEPSDTACFIAAARTALPALVAALRAAWRERDEAREASDNGWSNVNRINHELALVMVALNEVELEHNGVTSWKPLEERVRGLGKTLDAQRNDRKRAVPDSATDPLLTEEYRFRCALNAIANFREISVREHGCTPAEIMWWMVEQARSALSVTPNEEKTR